MIILAETILYAERNYIRNFRDVGTKKNKWCDELYADFAKQLGLVHDDDIRDFRVAGLAIMLVDDLYPHVDAMNPKGKEDATFQFNFRIGISDLDDECQLVVRQTFGENVKFLPFTLILYPRRCVTNYGKRLQEINDYPNSCEREKSGRSELISVLGDVGSTYDFGSRCLTRIGYSKRVTELLRDGSKQEYIYSKAAIDKMVCD